MPVTTKEVEKIADLANLKFGPEELERFVPQFQAILDYFTQLERVSTEGVEPAYHALHQDRLETPMREDKAEASLPTKLVLANAPDAADDYFRVPAVIEE